MSYKDYRHAPSGSRGRRIRNDATVDSRLCGCGQLGQARTINTKPCNVISATTWAKRIPVQTGVYKVDRSMKGPLRRGPYSNSPGRDRYARDSLGGVTSLSANPRA